MVFQRHVSFQECICWLLLSKPLWGATRCKCFIPFVGAGFLLVEKIRTEKRLGFVHPYLQFKSILRMQNVRKTTGATNMYSQWRWSNPLCHIPTFTTLTSFPKGALCFFRCSLATPITTPSHQKINKTSIIHHIISESFWIYTVYIRIYLFIHLEHPFSQHLRS